MLNCQISDFQIFECQIFDFQIVKFQIFKFSNFKNSNFKSQMFKVFKFHFSKISNFEFAIVRITRLGSNFGVPKKHKVATKVISYERYGEILFQKVASGCLVPFVQDGSSKNAL